VFSIVRPPAQKVLVNVTRPGLLAEFPLGPKVFYQVDFRLRILREYDGDDVESVRHLSEPENPPVDTSGSRYLSLLPRGHARERLGEFVGESCFYFNKAKLIPIERDDIDLAGDSNAAGVPSDRNLEIGKDESVAIAFEIIRSELFARGTDVGPG